jgi:hypothetical protein
MLRTSRGASASASSSARAVIANARIRALEYAERACPLGGGDLLTRAHTSRSF